MSTSRDVSFASNGVGAAAINTNDNSASLSAAPSSASLKPEPVTVAFTVGNTYRRLSPSEAKYDKLTGRHLKIHDWTLYVDILPGQDPDIIDRVTFDMHDDSFVTKAFTCHCPIRIRHSSGSAFIGQISGRSNQNNSQTQIGQSTKEEQKSEPSVATRPHPNQSRWRFSTRQQTFGPVDVQINIRGRGGCRCTVKYEIRLNPGGYECPADSLPLFIEKRPHQQLKPLKMMDSSFSLQMYFGLDGSSIATVAKSMYSRSKLPIKLLLENGTTEEFFTGKQSSTASKAWLVKIEQPSSKILYSGSTDDDTRSIISVASPCLSGGNGLNNCYKIIEGLPDSVLSNIPGQSTSALIPCLYVQIDVTTLSIQQIVKVCQNFVKYEEAMDSFMLRDRREDRCNLCRSNKQAMEEQTNKQRNQRISHCKTLDELVLCLNPLETHQYKLQLRSLVNQSDSENPKRCIQFRQHPSSKDKTVVTQWIRFCTAFVRNSARLRSPMALKATTSIDEEFDLLFEYVVKDRALRNFYRERRDAFEKEEELMHSVALAGSAPKSNFNANNGESSDSMSISDGSSGQGSNNLHLTSGCKRNELPDQLEPNKRACL